jgi:hypothetical protein
MIGQPAVPKELRQHCQRTGSECLVDERFLPIQGFNGGTTRQRVLTRSCVNDLWE